jgi:hypothetical protein
VGEVVAVIPYLVAVLIGLPVAVFIIRVNAADQQRNAVLAQQFPQGWDEDGSGSPDPVESVAPEASTVGRLSA